MDTKRLAQASMRVFVVDDEAVICTTLALILRQKGFDAVSFTRPSDALTAAALAPPELLISDIAMPDISGIELAILMQDLDPRCKVLLFSGQAATADLLENARTFGYDFRLLAKPVHPSDMLANICTLFSKQARPAAYQSSVQDAA